MVPGRMPVTLPLQPDLMHVQWLTWGIGAFERASIERKPVLLSIAAPWCQWCREMDRTSYGDPGVACLINDRFVPIRVDADRRPDISERYTLGGWPTTAFLTSAGQIVGGGTYIAADRMTRVLQQVLAAFGSRQDEIARRAAAAPASDIEGRVYEECELVSSVFETFDASHGGFGTEPKFPHVAPLRLALELHEAGDSRMARIVAASLDAMGWRGLYDEIDHGFFRYASTRDWRSPHVEKLLEVNAELASLFLSAGVVLGIARYHDRARDVLQYVASSLADPAKGGWAGSQEADATYYAASTSEARQRLPAPPVDRVLYAGRNGAMISTALQAARVLDQPALAEFAIKSLERVLLTCYRPGAGVAHYHDGAPRVYGLLEDQIAVATACLDAHEATGDVVYEMMAEELGHYAVRTMWDADRGGFFDRAASDADECVGLMRAPLKPFVANCGAAVLLRRLAATSGENEFAAKSDAILAAVAPLAARFGPLAAHYLLALRASRSR
jgi:uncharacterized protein YyaL (SSP411 family)